MTNITTTIRELSLQEMLADPIVQTMMTRDGVTRQDVEDLIETVRGNMAGRQIAEHKTGRHELSSIALEELRRQ